MSDRESKIRDVQRLRKIEQIRKMREKEGAVQAEAVATKPGVAESFMRGAAQGIGGISDELYGVVGAVVNPTDSDKAFADRYRDSRDYARGRDSRAQAANPKAFTTGQVGSGVASAFVPGAGAFNAAKGARAGQVMLKAGAVGAVTGLGLSEADVTKGEIPEAIADTAKGALLSAGTAGVINKVGMKIAPSALRSSAERRATKAAIGNQGKVYDELAAKGDINKVGRDLLDARVVRFGSRSDSIAKRASEARKASGQEIGDVLDEADTTALGGRARATEKLDFPWKRKAPLDGAKIAAKMRAYADEIDSPNNEAITASIRRQADNYEAMGNFSLKEGNRLKRSYKWKHGENQTLSQEATNKLKGIVSDEMEASVDQVGRVAGRASVAEPAEEFAESFGTGTGTRLRSSTSSDGQPVLKEATSLDDKSSLLERYKDAKSKYGSFETAAKGARKLATRQEKNRTFSLTDYLIGAAAGGASMNPIVGAAAAGGNKILRERGSSMAAVSLDKVSKMLKTGGEALGPFAKVLEAAAKNGNLAATHLLLMKSQPEYRELVRQQIEAREEGEK